MAKQNNENVCLGQLPSLALGPVLLSSRSSNQLVWSKKNIKITLITLHYYYCCHCCCYCCSEF